MLGSLGDWFGFIAKISLAVLVMAVVAYFSSHQVNWLSMNHGFTPMLERALWLVAVICVSAVTYFAVLFAAGFRMSDFRLVSHA